MVTKASTKAKAPAPADPREQYWRDLQLLESRRDGLRAELARVEAELEKRTAEFVAMLPASTKEPPPPPPPASNGDAGETFTSRVLAAVTRDMGALDVIQKLGLKPEDRRRVYDVLKKEAARPRGRIERTVTGCFEPRSP